MHECKVSQRRRGAMIIRVMHADCVHRLLIRHHVPDTVAPNDEKRVRLKIELFDLQVRAWLDVLGKVQVAESTREREVVAHLREMR